MAEHTQGKSSIIYLSIMLAMMLNVMPLPDWAEFWRPEWLAMALIYWTMALPRRVGLGTVFIASILMDVLQGSLIGQHAFGYVLMAYIAMHWHQRIRIFPLWQQSITVGLLLSLNLFLQLWVYGITANAPDFASYWPPVITSTIFWPWVFVALRHLRRKANLSH